jgi:hypothetical protein
LAEPPAADNRHMLAVSPATSSGALGLYREPSVMPIKSA